MADFPYGGTLYRAPEKKFRELVFFVHFYDGNQRLLKRHIEFVLELGFDAFGFELERDFSLNHPPLTGDLRFGYKHVYAAQIERLLNELPGDKIVYSFSNPTGAAIEAMARRNCSDVKALVCDSGPSGKFVRSVYNLYTREKVIPFAPLRWLATPLLCLAWSPALHGDVPAHLETFPEHFPVLSIRGWKDPLISPDQIDAVFEGHPRLDWRRLDLPEAGHLNGLRDFPDEYKPAVEKFLKEVASPNAT